MTTKPKPGYMPLSQRIRKWLDEHPKGGGCDDIAPELGVGKDIIAATMGHLKSDGLAVGIIEPKAHTGKRKRWFAPQFAPACPPEPVKAAKPLHRKAVVLSPLRPAEGKSPDFKFTPAVPFVDRRWAVDDECKAATVEWLQQHGFGG